MSQKENMTEELVPETVEELALASEDAEDIEGESTAPAFSLGQDKLRCVIEGALLASGQPLNMNKILGLFGEDELPDKADVLAALEEISAACEGRGFELKEIASGWRFQVRAETAPWVNRLFDEKPQKYSRALLETLALIAYRQPITRGDIEEIRGVAVSSHIIKTLVEREWIKVVGHRDVPGRPSLYATTRQFLDYFNLASLEQLPSLGEITDLESLNPELALDTAGEKPVADETTAECVDATESGDRVDTVDATETVEAPEIDTAEADDDDTEMTELDSDIEDKSGEQEEPSSETDDDDLTSSEETEHGSDQLDEEYESQAADFQDETVCESVDQPPEDQEDLRADEPEQEDQENESQEPGQIYDAASLFDDFKKDS